MRYISTILISFWLVSCGAPPVRTPAPAPPIIFISYPDYLQPSIERMAECASEIGELTIFTNPNPADQSNLPGPHLFVQLGGSNIGNKYVYQIGEEALSFIVNAENPVDYLASEELLAIYTGQQTDWDDAHLPPIQVWSYPAENDLRAFLEEVLPGTPRLTLEAYIAPDPQAILESISSDTSAIGYIPASWLDNMEGDENSQVRIIGIEPALHEKLVQPVVVTFSEPPTYQVEALLVCLQQDGD